MSRSPHLTREDLTWRPLFVMVGFIALLFMVVNAFDGGPLLTNMQFWSLLIAIPGARAFLELWVRFVEPRNKLSGRTISFIGFALLALWPLTGESLFGVLGSGTIVLGGATRLTEDHEAA